MILLIHAWLRQITCGVPSEVFPVVHGPKPLVGPAHPYLPGQTSGRAKRAPVDPRGKPIWPKFEQAGLRRTAVIPWNLCTWFIGKSGYSRINQDADPETLRVSASKLLRGLDDGTVALAQWPRDTSAA